MRLEVICQDRVGLTYEVLNKLVEHNIDLRGIEIDPEGKVFLNFPQLAFSEFQHLMPELRRIDGVRDVKTINHMPSEQASVEIHTLLKVMPDAVFSIDTKSRITLANEAAQKITGLEEKKLLGQSLGQFVSGFSFLRWLESEEVLPQTQKLRIGDEDYLADILSIELTDDDIQVLTGAVVVLKSATRVGLQFQALKSQRQQGLNGLLAISPKMKQLVTQTRRHALLDAPLLIQGDTGTGKEVLAKACHLSSHRASKAFTVINCAAFPDEAAEDELFGSTGRIGLIEQANGGTLLLDDVSEMGHFLQAKLLRLIQDGSFRRIGDDKESKVNVRIISTTSKPLEPLMAQGKFRPDLYYRLNVLNIAVPTLCERKEDIVPLAEQFASMFSLELQKTKPKIPRALGDYLEHYPWPGNVRQLKNAIYRAVCGYDGNEMTPAMLSLPKTETLPAGIESFFDDDLDKACKNFEKALLAHFYPGYPSTRQLAKKMGVSHTAIANKLREYGINKHKV